MAKKKTYYICTECGFKATNWMGRCSNCGSWNTLKEKDENETSSVDKTGDLITPHPITRVKFKDNIRRSTGIGELDRVLGGGIVTGSLILLGGAPGIGKSTLVLQMAFLFSRKYGQVLYISGEESPEQIKLRARRLKAQDDNLFVLGETEFDKIAGLLQQQHNYELIIIDSIQTIYDSRYDSSPGSISQVKEITGQLLKIAKKQEIPVLLIGHVTKEGDLAGPRALEHLVDTVLQFEGDSNYTYRILRSIKNRFGSTNEIGVFEMLDTGMREVANPSRFFIEERPQETSGSIIVPVMEGSRTILVEVQALISSAAYSTPQRLTTGVDRQRVSILLAVLEKKAGFALQDQDVHLNITGGLKVNEPVLDLGIITAVISSFRDYSLSAKIAVAGEIGLAGEVRAVSHIKKRIQELIKMGFKKVIIPCGNTKGLNYNNEIDIKGIKNIHQLMNVVFR